MKEREREVTITNYKFTNYRNCDMFLIRKEAVRFVIHPVAMFNILVQHFFFFSIGSITGFSILFL